MNRKAEAPSTIYLGCQYTFNQLWSSLTSQNLFFNEFNNIDVNISNHTIRSMDSYLFIFYSILKFTYFNF